MIWNEVVMIWFSCVAANHLGLIAAIEEKIEHSLPIMNCPKCFTFWALTGYGVFAHEIIFVTIATSFLFAYLASWLELGMGFIDSLYMKLYEKISPDTTDDASAADADNDHTTGTMP